MNNLKILHDRLKKAYDLGQSPIDLVGETASYAISLLADRAIPQILHSKYGKEYWVFTDKNNRSRLSRPYLPSHFIKSQKEFKRQWDEMVSCIDTKKKVISLAADDVNSILYSAVTAYCVCFDLWNPKARKTPGTFFEMFLGSVIGRILPAYKRTKSIQLPCEEKISTDIVFTHPGAIQKLVIACKITTRERISQPYVHQRILDSTFGIGHYRTILMCVSELQRNGENGVNEICVPGTVKLYQQHLGSITGMYYLDLPVRYLKNDITDLVPVSPIGGLLTVKLPNLLL